MYRARLVSRRAGITMLPTAELSGDSSMARRPGTQTISFERHRPSPVAARDQFERQFAADRIGRSVYVSDRFRVLSKAGIGSSQRFVARDDSLRQNQIGCVGQSLFQRRVVRIGSIASVRSRRRSPQRRAVFLAAAAARRRVCARRLRMPPVSIRECVRRMARTTELA